MLISIAFFCSLTKDGIESTYNKNGAKNKTMKSNEPSFAATISVKIKNYKTNPTINTQNSEAIHITCSLHQ